MKTVLILTLLFSRYHGVAISTESVQFNSPEDCTAAAKHFNGEAYQNFIKSAADYHQVRISATCHPNRGVK